MMLYISPKYGLKADSVSLIQAARGTNVRTNTLLHTWNTDRERGMYGGPKEHSAVYGEHAFCEFVAQELRLNLFSNSLDWVTRVHKTIRKRNIQCMTLDDIINKEAESRSIVGFKVLEPADDACFQTGIYTGRLPRAPKDTKILVQDEVEWVVKYRFLIVHGKIESFCCYRVTNVVDVPAIRTTKFVGRNITADMFVSTILEHYNTAPACIIDVGFIKDTGWAVCGTYPVWSSELYGLDPQKFLNALFVACQPIE